jgi:murein tripeptide amidase MpaA
VAFYGKGKSKRETIMFIGGIHGHEVKNIASLINLIEIIEKGIDLRKRKWPHVTSILQKFNLIIIPLANPDGRERVKIDELLVLHYLTGKKNIIYNQSYLL